MTRYILRDGQLVSRETNEPLELPERGEITAPYIASDIPAYMSVASGKMIDGRADRREDLKRTGCRECDPSEFKVQYRDKDRAIAAGREWNPEANKRPIKYSGFLA